MQLVLSIDPWLPYLATGIKSVFLSRLLPLVSVIFFFPLLEIVADFNEDNLISKYQPSAEESIVACDNDAETDARDH